VGIRAILLHAISEEAKRFYLHHRFAESPVDPMMMMITLADVEKAIGGQPERVVRFDRELAFYRVRGLSSGRVGWVFGTISATGC
jgi:hypothetical protein